MSLLVGAIVGAVGATGASGASTLSDNGEGYDFAIGGLGFRLAINDERKYERATAQFRKEQLDTADRVGDQSLVGYWTRGQLSFHEGAGQKYADQTPDSDGARYWESSGVNPFVKGEASLYKAWTDASGTTFASPLLAAHGVTDQTIAALSGGKVHIGGLGTTLNEYAPAGTVTSLSSGGGVAYCGLGDKKISRVGDTVPVIYQQDFTAGVGDWSSLGVDPDDSLEVIASMTTSSASPDGANGAYLQVTWPVTAVPDASSVFPSEASLVSGRTYTQVARVWLAVGTGGKVVPGRGGTKGSAIATEGAWTTVAWTFVAGASNPGFTNTDLGASESEFRVDRFTIYEGAVSDYQTGTPSSTLYSHTLNVSGVHYVKGRILMVDEDGAWYQLAPNPTGALPVATVDGDKVFTLESSKPWVVSDTPGPVLLATGNQVFALKQSDTTGLFPVLSAPVMVAELPMGEDILTMATYLGFVGLVTTKGFRVAILTEAGDITYGPRVIDFTSTPVMTTIARKGDSFVIAADETLYEVNLGIQLGSGLEFAWAELPTPFAGGEGSYGVTNCGSTLVAWGSTALVSESANPATAGHLQTGYHRFGTLENKKFQTIHVRGEGSGGHITVSKVDANGTVTPLYTMDLSVQQSGDITLRADAPTERLALRFDLSPTGANGPSLLGYQLRALPAPLRQRMIRVPLALHDVERRGTTRAAGRTGGAWERLRALEEMEAGSSIVTYQDFRTGESGQAYIEQVSHEGDTPPGRQGDGFGGVVWVTLRKL